MKVDAHAFSEPGPRSTNEDALLMRLEGDLAILAVADGLGGLGGGGTASDIAIQLVKSASPDKDLHQLVHEVHEAILAAQAEDGSAMATTLTVARIRGNILDGAHCGDTRCIIQRGNGIRKLTRAHTEAQRLLDAGKLSKKQFLEYPRRNILESALGTQKAPRIDNFSIELKTGDRIVLSSDGVHEKVLLRDLLEIIKDGDAFKITQALKNAVLEKGPEDNYTAICAIVE